MTDTNSIDHHLSEVFPTASPLPHPDTAIAWLSHEAVMAVSGPDSAKFLQGQLTCDVVRLPLPGSVMGARCNPKGRMQSSFRLVRQGETHYLLAMAAELLEPQITDLARYAAFFKTEITDAGEHWLRLGLWGAESVEAATRAGLPVPQERDQVAASESGTVVRLPGHNAFEIWLPAASARDTLDRLLETATAVALNDWHLLQIRNGVGQVFGETRESFIPQMLNLQIFDAVSFKKGCYTGQEIVARMKYLGKLKKRMFRLISDEGRLLAPGTTVVNRETGQGLGEVVICATDGERMEMLAVLQKDAAQLVSLSATDGQGPLLTVAELPYESEVADNDVGPAN